MAWYPAEFDLLLAVAAATLDRDGTLIDANAGFLALLRDEQTPQPLGMIVTRFFIQPSFATLAERSPRSNGEIHAGLLTIGTFATRTISLRARIWRVANELRVLAEYDVEDLRRLNETVLELNLEYGKAQLALTQANFRLQQREAEILSLSLTDPLTGVGNRRRLEQALVEETSRADRTDNSLSAFMADLDHFKRVNDTHGHENGDKVLTAFGDVLRRNTRSTDVVGRFGGEEFVVLMPHTKLAQAASIAERIREALASITLDSLPQPVTVSIGVVELNAGEAGDGLIRRADAALYEAKRLGRNRVVIADERLDLEG